MSSRSEKPETEWPLPFGASAAHEWPVTHRAPRTDAVVSFRPILDVARGVAAGYQAVGPLDDVRPRGRVADPAVRSAAVTTAEAALAATTTLPTNTFISIRIPLALADDGRLRDVLRAHGDLSGVVLDITDFSAEILVEAEAALDGYREAGALLAVGGRDAPQPELGSIVRLRPAIIRLGRAWIRGVEESAAKRSAIEVTGQLASQVDAWILAESVSTTAELRALAALGVPLAQGPLIGEPDQVWLGAEIPASSVLPRAAPAHDGALRTLIQNAYTARDATSATDVLPDSAGFDLVVVVDDRSRPVALLQQDGGGHWGSADVLTVNIETPVTQVALRAMARPMAERFSPVACTDSAGRFLGILRIDRLVAHLAGQSS